VFELVLRQPESNEYLIDDGESGSNRSVALTLAVALRFALASKLGISAAELGFGTRPAQIDGRSVLVIQLYDELSGGAGFASSAPEHIEDLLLEMTKRLQCSHCDTACSECLLDSSTRHHHDRLDHVAAAAWLGEHFSRRIQLPESEQLVPGAKYQPRSIEGVIHKGIREGATKLTVCLTGDQDDWDLSARQFRKAIHNYLLVDDIQVELILPDDIQSKELQEDLLALKAVGAQLRSRNLATDSAVVAQLEFSNKVLSIAASESVVSAPGEQWHQSGGLTLVSDVLGKLDTLELDTSGWSESKLEGAASVKNLEISSELDGNLRNFGTRFWNYLSEEVEGLSTYLNSDDISVVAMSYTDRYLQSPAYILLLTSILAPIASKLDAGRNGSLKTLFKMKDRSGYLMFHDWAEDDHFEEFTKAWLSDQCGLSFGLDVVNANRDIPHHRKLEIKFSDGQTLIVRFDQGVGYWRVEGNTRFDFSEDVNYLVNTTKDRIGMLKVRSSESWATDISVEFVRTT
jgi:hypothetical protein